MGKGRKFGFLVLAITLLVLVLAAAQASAMDVTLAWDPNSEADLAGYKIHWGTASGGPYPNNNNIPLSTTGFNPAQPQHTVTGLDANVRYYFVATAYDLEGLESGFSNEVSADGITGIAPAPPSGLKPLKITIQRPDGTTVTIDVP